MNDKGIILNPMGDSVQVNFVARLKSNFGHRGCSGGQAEGDCSLIVLRGSRAKVVEATRSYVQKGVSKMLQILNKRQQLILGHFERHILMIKQPSEYTSPTAESNPKKPKAKKSREEFYKTFTTLSLFNDSTRKTNAKTARLSHNRYMEVVNSEGKVMANGIQDMVSGDQGSFLIYTFLEFTLGGKSIALRIEKLNFTKNGDQINLGKIERVVYKFNGLKMGENEKKI
jgi:hypothetical protein